MIAEKTNKTLRFLLLALFLILFRIWHLCFIQREEHQELALKPKKKVVVEPAERGTIYDRNQMGLALNRVRYQAAVYFGQIAQIPSVKWERDITGKRIKTYPRKEYIRNLAALLGKELTLDPDRIVDLIYAKAALLPSTPFLVKEHLTEQEYFRLRMLERDWTGLHAQIVYERFYPLGKTACDVLGFIGAIGQEEYLSIANEIEKLKDFLNGNGDAPDGILSEGMALQKLKNLQERAYTVNDRMGKTGIEKSFEKELRGYWGMNVYEADRKGNFLKELQGSRIKIPGKKITLSLSAEMQEFAEALLAEEEKDRDKRFQQTGQKVPWIKGGAIVVLDPNTSEVLTLASYPRFDPNDYTLEIEDKASSINRWLETEEYIARLWDGKEPLKKEVYSFTKKEFSENSLPISWESYLDFILPKEGGVRAELEKIATVQKAIELQEDMEEMIYYSKQSDPLKALSDKTNEEIAKIQKKHEALFSAFSNPKDLLFLIDLCRLVVHSPSFSDELIEKIGNMSLSSYRLLSQEILRLEEGIKKEISKNFHENEFKAWKEINETSFLKEMRRLEKSKKTYARPYVDYLDKQEDRLFKEFWREKRGPSLLLAVREKNLDLTKDLDDALLLQLIRSVRSFHELDRPLYYQTNRLRKENGISLEKHLAASFYPLNGFGNSRSFAYKQPSVFGSNFKLITAYAALKRKMETTNAKTYAEINPFTMIDEFHFDPKVGKKGSYVVGYSMDHTPYPRHYKGGRLPRSSHFNMGKIDLLGALEQSSNPYFSLLASEYLKDPSELLDAALAFGLGQKTGIELPTEAPGNLPNDLNENKSGLYSFAIGQHTLSVTPLQAAQMLSVIATHGKAYTPQIVKEISGRGRKWQTIPFPSTYPYQKELGELGIGFPLFTYLLKDMGPSDIQEFSPIEKRLVFLPPLIRNTLLEGMQLAVSGERGTARYELIRGKNREFLKGYKEVGKSSFFGKTSTAEFLYNPYMTPSSTPSIYNHVWFGAISFPPETADWETPEVVVMVFLRFSKAGRDAAPLAYQMVEKYRELKARQKNGP